MSASPDENNLFLWRAFIVGPKTTPYEVKKVHVFTLFVQRRKIRLIEGGIFWIFSFFMYDIQHWFICRPSDSTVSEDAGIGPRTVATTALAVRCSN